MPSAIQSKDKLSTDTLDPEGIIDLNFRYREALAKEVPCLGIGEKEKPGAAKDDGKTQVTAP